MSASRQLQRRNVHDRLVDESVDVLVCRLCASEGRDADLRRPAFLSRIIISMILLGGAVGKWTSEYWSGEVLYQIYFAERDFWVFNLLRDNFDADTLREIATWYSRNVIIVETVCGSGLMVAAATLGRSHRNRGSNFDCGVFELATVFRPDEPDRPGVGRTVRTQASTSLVKSVAYLAEH